ncbi:MAG: hypothetical protein R2941_17195 [Desulfobacterales bacterium]
MSQSHRHREESVNTQLAPFSRSTAWMRESETIQTSGKHRPDVMFLLGGLRVIIEGKFSDTPGADKVVLSDALRRVQIGICHIAVALRILKRYPHCPHRSVWQILSGFPLMVPDCLGNR